MPATNSSRSASLEPGTTTEALGARLDHFGRTGDTVLARSGVGDVLAVAAPGLAPGFEEVGVRRHGLGGGVPGLSNANHDKARPRHPRRAIVV